MPQPSDPRRSGQRPQRRPQGNRVPQKKTGSGPTGKTHRYPPPIPYQEPAIRDSAPIGSGLLAAAGFVALLLIGFFAFKSCGGVDLPKGGGGNNALPNVSIDGAKPCVRSDSSRVNLNTQDRVNACVAAKKYAKQRVVQKHGADGENQFRCLDELWVNESAWSPWAVNPSSGAWGIAQILPEAHPNPKVGDKPVGRTDWKSQVEWGLNYIWGRADYGSPCKAWELWQSRSPHWY